MSSTQEPNNNCTCHDESQIKQRTCMNCKIEKSYPMPYPERVSKCQVHRGSIAICGPSLGGAICDACEAEGFYLSSTGHWPAAKYEVKRHEN